MWPLGVKLGLDEVMRVEAWPNGINAFMKVSPCISSAQRNRVSTWKGGSLLQAKKGGQNETCLATP